MRALAICALVAIGCGSEGIEPQPGRAVATGIFAPLGEPRPSATPAEREAFQRGLDGTRVQLFVEDGLGPTFNATSCGACHERPVAGGGAGRYRDFLLGETPDGGARVQPQYTTEPIGRAPTLEGATTMAKRHPVAFFGVGLLAEIPEAEILGRADPNDADGDGIRGRANVEVGFVGRFGRKAQLASIEAFLRAELADHAGITTDPLNEERRAELPVAETAPEAFALADEDGVADPELGADELAELVSFTMLLAAPEPAAPTVETAAGAARFETLGCTACHVPALAGPRGLIPAFSDLLVHDMGPELADSLVMGVAGGSDFRTQPLWGIAAVGPYLHDGRADTIHDAIVWHGGEALAARDAYAAMDGDEQGTVVAFLASLGGMSQASPGLLRPGAPLPAAGEIGAPLAALEGDELASFERGRAAFDRDFAIEEGLGGLFNGDSCRACHFQPVIGGAGPADVDVCRHGFVDPLTGIFSAPSAGTMAHRHSIAPERPPIDDAANVFELRQTPALFGLGLVDRIPAAAIVAREDPDDADGDGISGRAHILPDGRLGRFGWKANVPTLREFSRDAMSNELGIALAAEAGQTFGAIHDDDGVADPEIAAPELADMVAFLEGLAPPPRAPTDPPAEARGEAVFVATGCASCHVVEMAAADGAPVRLYSDLLLHDVAPAGATGIAAGDAGPRELRTPPLWGVSRSAPYLHDGRASTLEGAIGAHHGEAQAARLSFERLDADDRADLLALLRSL